MMALLPRAVPAKHLATALGVFYSLFYLGMAVSQTLAGLVRDLTGDPAMPLLFAAALMVLTVPAVALFWRIEARPDRGDPEV
jgi:predicted MFS family arabinose efflux permease